MSKKFNDWVRPGVFDVRARPRVLSRELMMLDFPTLERPMKAISGFASRGQSLSWKELFRNSALVILIFDESLGFTQSSSPVLQGQGKNSNCALVNHLPKLWLCVSSPDSPMKRT